MNTSVEETQDELRLHIRSRSKSYQCPKCGGKLYHLHATYHRKVLDFPILGKRVMLDMTIHDFQCLNENCSIGAIAKTFGGFLDYYSRMTERLVDFVMMLGIPKLTVIFVISSFTVLIIFNTHTLLSNHSYLS